MEEDESIVLLSSLLHDIGKFLQRAYGLKKRHYEYSSEFIDMYIPKGLFGNNVIEKVKEIVREHHSNRSDPLLDIVREADHISASEREYANLESESELESIKLSVYRKLATPFSQKSYYPLTVLSTDYKRFIDGINSEENLTSAIYYNHLTNFLGNVEVFKDIPYRGRYARAYYIESLLHLMKAWLFTIPSAPYYERVPTISLYEHLRTSMAIAHSLYINRKKGSEGFVFVLIDIGGIQRFIYNIHPQKALKALRGRSFYVALLTEAIAKYLIHNLGLLECNIITLGGGHSLLLLPSSLLDKLEELIDRVRVYIFNRFGVRINLYIGMFKTNVIAPFGDIYNALHYNINEAKSRPLNYLLSKGIGYYSKIFEPEEIASNICHICNYSTNNKEDDEGIVKCNICKELEDIAKPLADAKYIVEIIGSNVRNLDIKGIVSGIYPIIFDELDICYMLVSNNDYLDRIVNLEILKDAYIRIYRLNSTDISSIKRPYTVGFKFIANVVPMSNDNEIMTLDDVIKHARGANILGVLKMDVDNLGKFFSNSTTLSEYSTKSTIIDLFFNGFLNNIANRTGIYIIYAGGDDLFVIGPWNEIVELAHHIFKEFNRFTLGSSVNTLSAGIVLCDEHTPAYIFADEAKSALDLSKKNGKNRVTIFNRSIIWDTFAECLQIYRELADAIDEDKLSRGTIFNMLSSLRESIINSEPRSIKRYRLVYTITNIKKHNKEAVELINKIEDKINAYIEWLDISLRLGEFATRR